MAGTSKRHGHIRDGTTLTDYAPEEIERGYSINLGVANAEWMDCKINLIDTPGYLDFHGEAIAGLEAADGVLLCVSANSGVEVGSEKMFRAAVQRRDPVLFVATLMDKEHANFDRIYQQIKTRLTNKVIPVEMPIGAGAGFKGIMNLFTRKAYMYKPGTKTGEYEEVDIRQIARSFAILHDVIEAISATATQCSSATSRGEIVRDEAIRGMKEAMSAATVPLFCVSAELTYGIGALMTAIVQLCRRRMRERLRFKGAVVTRGDIPRCDRPFCAHVFKTSAGPHVGDVSSFRIFPHSGARLGGLTRRGDAREGKPLSVP